MNRRETTNDQRTETSRFVILFDTTSRLIIEYEQSVRVNITFAEMMGSMMITR